MKQNLTLLPGTSHAQKALVESHPRVSQGNLKEAARFIRIRKYMYAQHRSIIFSRQQVFFVVLVQCTVVTLVLKTILRIGESANIGGKKYLSLLEVEVEQSLFAFCGITHFLIAST